MASHTFDLSIMTQMVGEMVEISGYLAGILTISSYIPQVYKSWNTRRVEDLSKATGILLALTALTWTVYGFLMDSMPMILTNSVVFFLVLSIVSIPFLSRSHP